MIAIRRDNRSVARALEVLELFAKLGRPLFVTEIAKALNVPLSSCFLIVKTLERDGYLYSLGSRRGFYPTGKVLHLGQLIQASDPLEPVIGEALRDLRDETGETVMLSQLVEAAVVAVYVCESRRPIRFFVEVGDRWPVHSTSIGRSLLGAVGERERERYIAKLDLAQLTEHTVRTKADLVVEIDRGQQRGWHVSAGETFSDLFGISRVVFIRGKSFSVTVGGPMERLKPQLDSLKEKLEIACNRLTDRT